LTFALPSARWPASPSPSPALTWDAIVHSTFVSGVSGEREFREWRAGQIALISQPPAPRSPIFEGGLDLILGAADWSMRSIMHAVRASHGPLPDPESHEPSLTDSFLAMVERPARQEGSFNALISNLLHYEWRYFRKFEGSYLNPIEVELGYRDFDSSEVMADQMKVGMDALLKTLVERNHLDDLSARFRQESFEVWRYRGKDLIVLPPAVGALLYYRGLDYKFHVRGLKVRFVMASVSEWMDAGDSDESLTAGLGVEVSTPIRGLKVIAAAGFHDRRPELDFIGLGTDLEIVKKAITAAER
jgi:hypothetical protein